MKTTGQSFFGKASRPRTRPFQVWVRIIEPTCGTATSKRLRFCATSGRPNSTRGWPALVVKSPSIAAIFTG